MTGALSVRWIIVDMYQRSEPRFKTEAHASIQVLRDRAQEFEAMITDASSVGLGIQMADPLRPREVIRICTESDYVFAIVQHCTAIDENHYSIGVVRIDEWHPVGDRKPDLESLRQDAPATMEAVKKPRLDLGDLQTHAIKELFKQSPDKAERSQKEARQDKKAINAAAERLQAAADPSSSESKAAETTDAPEESVKTGKKPAKARLPKKSMGRAKVIGASAGMLILLLLLAGVGTGFRFGLGQTASAEIAPQPTNVDAASPSDAEEALADSDATQLQADETQSAADATTTDPTADNSAEDLDEARQLAATQAPAAAPIANAAEASPQTSNSAPGAAPQPAPPQTARKSAPAGTGEHAVLIQSSGPSWVTVCVDHAKAFEGLVNAGDSREFSYHDRMLLRSGNIGALSVSRDAKPVTTSNVVGTIAAWEFTPTGAQPTDIEATKNCN